MGTSKWVHRKCLDNWRATRHNKQCFTHCTTCNYQYRICKKEPRVSKRWKLFLLLTRDILTLLIIAELLIVIMSAVSFGLDRAAGLNILHIFPPAGAQQAAAEVGIYYLAGIVFFFAALGIIGLIVGSFCLCCRSPGCCDDNSTGFWAVYCCWFGYPCHFGYYYPVAPIYGGGCAGCGGCYPVSGTNCNFGGNAHGLIILLIVILVILVIIGLIFATIILVWFILVVGRRHFDILYRRELAKEAVVCDLSMYQHTAMDSLPEYLEYEGAPQEIP